MILLLAQQQAAAASDLREKLILTIVDKGLLALLIVVAGYWFNRLLERFKGQQATLLETFRSQRSLENELAKLKEARNLEALERQLSQFYWPIYMRLHLAHTVWRRISNKRSGDSELREKIGREIEKNLVIPNHEEVVRIIQSNIHLAETDGELFKAMLDYTGYVQVLRALRAAGHYDVDPKDLGEPWPDKLPQLIAKWAYTLQDRYDALVTASASSPQPGAAEQQKQFEA